MPVTSVIVITQFEIDDVDGSIRDIQPGTSVSADVRDVLLSVTSSSTQTHPPAITQPAASSVAGGWSTPTPPEDYWTDSFVFQPYLLNRYRFAYGRDEAELFDQPAQPGQPGEEFIAAIAPPGRRWGKLDANSGILTYQRDFGIDSSVSMLEFRIESYATMRDALCPVDSSSSIHELGPVTGDVTLRIYPFVLTALPVPYSIKNPIATDIYIRLGNFTSIFNPESFALYIDGQLQPTLIVDEFFSGLGGFDVTWENSMLFEYDARVNVRWEFRDLDIPANLFVVSYSFDTVPDLASPRISSLTPSDEATGVAIQNSIQFDVEDYENDVDIDSLLLYVNNVRVINGETGSLETIRFQNEKGYTVKYTPNSPWRYGDVIPVAIFISDTSKNKNETFYTYSFTTLESTPPRMINLRPLACNVAVPVSTHISVDLIDGGHGLDKSSIVFTVEDIERSGQVALIPIIHRDE